MEARQVTAGQGWRWIAAGYALFRKNPPIWIVLFLSYFILLVAVSQIPLLGPLVMSLLAPVFTAGFMLACRAVERGEELEFAYLFAGFRQHTAQLVTVGGFYMVGSIMILGVMMFSGGGAILGAASMGGLPAPDGSEVMVGAVEGAAVALLVGLALLVPLLMAYWFAPALVVFHGMPALEAMKLSFVACWRNLLPFLVYGLASFGLMIVAMIPFGLGMLVLIPTLNASLYAGYRDVFAIPEPAVA